MTSDNPFFMNFNVSDFMSKFAVPGTNNEYSKKLMYMHQKNLDAFVNANKVVSDGYKAIATKQMEILQNGLTRMAGYSPEQAAEMMESTFKESADQMTELVEMATKAHKEAYEILASRAKDVIAETKA